MEWERGMEGERRPWREREKERCRQNQTAKRNNRFRERAVERERERFAGGGGYDVVKKCEPSRRMQTACTE